MSATILKAQRENKTRALVLHESSPRPSRTVVLGGFFFQASLLRGWPAKNLLARDGGMMVVGTVPDEFYILGRGLRITFLRDPDVDDGTAGIASIEQLSYRNGRWSAVRRLNGDQSDQGRALLMAPHEFHVYRVKLYTYATVTPR